jgi:glycosyltransferase involved in cell wall biosynthesis
MQPRTVLFVIASLEYSGAARQLTLLASGLPRELFHVRVVVLGTDSPWVESLRAAGVEVEVLGWRRSFDVLPFLALRRIVKSMRPDVVHVWGVTALRAMVMSGSRGAKRLFVSAAVRPAQTPGNLDRWLLRRIGNAVVFSAAEAERYRQLGVAESHIRVVAPAVKLPAVAIEPVQLSGVSASDRVLLAQGPIEPNKGFREAVWAFDILRHLYDDVHLVLVGSGSDRPRVERFARRIGVARQVHFLGICANPAPLLHRADLVWVPSLRGGGICTALEAMAAGRTVVASRCPDLAEVIVDGETGFLVEPDDKAALARQTRFLLDDPAQRRRCGAAGRQRVAELFSVARLVQACGHLYGVDSEQ